MKKAVHVWSSSHNNTTESVSIHLCVCVSLTVCVCVCTEKDVIKNLKQEKHAQVFQNEKKESASERTLLREFKQAA